MFGGMGSAKKVEEVIVETDRQLSTQTICQTHYDLYGFCLDFNPMSLSCLPLNFPARMWNHFLYLGEWYFSVHSIPTMHL